MDPLDGRPKPEKLVGRHGFVDHYTWRLILPDSRPLGHPAMTYAELNDFFNGPVFDGDGYIDGTCNFYALSRASGRARRRRAAEPRERGYALLYQDEQSYFSKRWRLVHPDDGGRVRSLRPTPPPSSAGPSTTSAAKYWDPFRPATWARRAGWRWPPRCSS